MLLLGAVMLLPAGGLLIVLLSLFYIFKRKFKNNLKLFNIFKTLKITVELVELIEVLLFLLVLLSAEVKFKTNFACSINF